MYYLKQGFIQDFWLGGRENFVQTIIIKVAPILFH